MTYEEAKQYCKIIASELNVKKLTFPTNILSSHGECKVVFDVATDNLFLVDEKQILESPYDKNLMLKHLATVL